MNLIRGRGWPKRKFPAPGQRDMLSRARFFAFSKLFESCKSNFERHVVTESDKAHVYSLTRRFIREDIDARDLVAGEDELTNAVVDQAVELFLKI